MERGEHEWVACDKLDVCRVKPTRGLEYIRVVAPQTAFALHE